MSKVVVEVDDFDFGFTATTSDQIVAPVVQDLQVKQQSIDEAEQVFSDTLEEHQKRINNLLKAITPLLNNLAKDADTKEYIHWPNRKAKIEEFRIKLNNIAGK